MSVHIYRFCKEKRWCYIIMFLFLSFWYIVYTNDSFAYKKHREYIISVIMDGIERHILEERDCIGRYDMSVINELVTIRIYHVCVLCVCISLLLLSFTQRHREIERYHLSVNRLLCCCHYYHHCCYLHHYLLLLLGT
jgi:hypothetical protein